MDRNSWTLRELTLMNWGTYDGLQTIDVTPSGEDGRMATCLEGVNGSGKTTLTDAYMMLIRPVNTIFNAASNSSGRSQDKRTVLSYMRGEVGDNPKTGEPWLVRDSDIIVSAIKGLFATDDGRTLEAAILMCVNCATDIRERKLYATSDATIDLQMLADVLPSQFTPQGLREHLGKDVALTEQYSKYLEVLAQTFGVSDRWADFQRLTRLLSMVQGEDAPNKSRINELFKAYVLPASDVAERINAARRAIEDNTASLADLTKKKTLIETLEPMQDISEEMTSCLERLGRLYDVTGKTRIIHESSGTAETTDPDQATTVPLRLFLAEHKGHVTALRIEQTKVALDDAAKELDAANRQAKAAEIAYAKAAGAMTTSTDSRVQTAQTELDQREQTLERAEDALRKAQGNLDIANDRLDVAKRAHLRAQAQLARDKKAQQTAIARTQEYISRGKAYGLSAWPKTADAWSNMLATISTIDVEHERELKKRCEAYPIEMDRKRTELAKAEQRLDTLLNTKAKLGANYPKLIRARDMIAAEMGIPPEELPFLAEVLKIKEGEADWTLAVNTQLSGITKQMLVDKSYVARFRKISHRVERTLDYRVSYKEVDVDADETCADKAIQPGTVASKVEPDWQSDYAFSALSLVLRNDAICVEDATEFTDDKRHYVTRGGHVHNGRNGSIGINRRDADLIGFVDQTSIEDATATVEDLRCDIHSDEVAYNRCKRELADIAVHRAFAEELHRVSFEDLDLTAYADTVSASETDVADCEQDIKSCEATVHDAQVAIEDETRSVEAARQAVASATAMLQKMQEEASAADKALREAFEKARLDQERALEHRGAVKKNHDEIKGHLASYEQLKRQFDAQDTSALTEAQRTLCEGFAPRESLGASFDGFLAAIERRCSTIADRIATEIDKLEMRLSALSSDFGAHEGTLGEYRYDQLSGMALQQAATATANSALDGKHMADPWERPRIRWFVHYSHLLEQLRQEWSDIDLIGAKRVCACETMDAVETLMANAKSTEKDISRRMQDVNNILSHVRLGSEDHTLSVTYDFRKKAAAAKTYKSLTDIIALADITRDTTATEDQLDEVCAATLSAATLMKDSTKDVMAALDPNEYVNIAFIETRDGHEHKHANLGKLSGGEVQQISACVIGAALLYAMDTEPGDAPCYATVVIDEAFVKADEEHSVATLATLIDMGFTPIVSMPPEGVMKLSPCISKLMAVTKHDMKSRVDQISLDELRSIA